MSNTPINKTCTLNQVCMFCYRANTPVALHLAPVALQLASVLPCNCIGYIFFITEPSPTLQSKPPTHPLSPSKVLPVPSPSKPFPLHVLVAHSYQFPECVKSQNKQETSGYLMVLVNCYAMRTGSYQGVRTGSYRTVNMVSNPSKRNITP